MQNQYANQKPEIVLKRANDLINTATGNAIKEKNWALEILHNFIAAKKRVLQWSKVYETLMKRHLELCIDLKNPHFAKDGLHQYRNLCQTLDPNSLEVVIMHMMDITESEASKARAKADKVALAAAAKVSDLDQEESPEGIMLSSMTESGSKERTDREVVVPWLKFLWETFRAVLELLHRIPKLDKVYHKICEKAFKFCQDYSRNLEFRRLCEMLRGHLSNLQRNAARTSAKVVWEWTSDSVEMHLQTRFNQLEVATSLELWNESFRTIEDIHAITVAGRKTPKPKLMAVYYEKLTRIFWVSGNHLFHAFAYFRYYNLTCEFRHKDLKTDEKALLASYVLLSALTIPSLKDSDYSMTIMEDEAVTDRNQQMATILDFQSNPTRKALLQDIVNKNILNEILPELKGLYELLDNKFHPLNMVKSLSTSIAFIKNHPVLHVYAIPLQRVIVLRVMQQLSRVYSVVKMDFLKNLFNGLTDISLVAAEKIMIDGVLRKELQLNIDHVNKVVKFIVAPTISSIENQITTFGNDLYKIKNTIQQKEIEQGSTAILSRLDQEKAARQAHFATILSSAEKYHQLLLSRKHIIEKRKVDIERAQEEREKVQQIILDREGARRQAEEESRLELEKQKREDEKRKKLIEKEEIRRVQKDLEKLGVFKDEATLAALDTQSRLALVTEAKSELVKAREEENKKVLEQAKRLDYITRALRIESADILKQRQEQQLLKDQELYNEQILKLKTEAKSSHEVKVMEKKRLQKMQPNRAHFEKLLLAEQKAMYEKQMDKLKMNIIKEYRERKVAKARRLYNEEIERLREEEELERERKDKEERARIEKEQYEILRKKRLEEEAIEKAKEAEENRIKEEKRLELEVKRQKAIEEQKARSKLSAATSASGGDNGDAIAPSVTVAAAGKPAEKEIVWRAPPSSAVSGAESGGVGARGASAAAAGGGAESSNIWRGSSGGGGSGGDRSTSEAFPPKEPAVERWRPSGAAGASAAGGDRSGMSGAAPPSRGGAAGGGGGGGEPAAWRGSSAGGSGAGASSAPGGGISRSKLDDWGRSAPSAPSGGGTSGGVRRGFGDSNDGAGAGSRRGGFGDSSDSQQSGGPNRRGGGGFGDNSDGQSRRGGGGFGDNSDGQSRRGGGGFGDNNKDNADKKNTSSSTGGGGASNDESSNWRRK